MLGQGVTRLGDPAAGPGSPRRRRLPGRRHHHVPRAGTSHQCPPQV